MKVSVLISILYLLSLSHVSEQKTHNTTHSLCDIKHHIGIGYVKFSPNDTIVDGTSKYIPLNCEGDLKVLDYYPTGELFLERNYSATIDSIVHNLFDPSTFEETEELTFFYTKIPTGKWKFYSREGKLIDAVMIE